MDPSNEVLESQAEIGSPTPASSEEEIKVSMETLLEQDEHSLEFPKAGELRQGFVVSINNDQVLVGIGAKSEGIIPYKEIQQLDEEERAQIVVGAQIPVYIVTPEDSDGNLILSYGRAIEESDWARAESMRESSEIYESTIAGYNKGGLIVKMGRLRGFVPASQVSLSRRASSAGGATPDQRWAKMVGEPIIVRVIEVDRERRRLIFSEMAAIQESREIFKERLLAELEAGQIFTGRVTSLADFGAFVNINGADGLVHLTEITWDRIKHPSEALKVGQEVKVKVISIDQENKRIGLSIRQLQPDPWPEKVSIFTEGQLVEGTVVRLAKFGAFVRINGTDLEGLVHISELSEGRVEHPKEAVKEGQKLTLRVIKIDPENHRIGLSVRKVTSAQYAHIDMAMALNATTEAETAETAVAAAEIAETAVPAAETAETAVPAADTAETAQDAAEEAASPAAEANTPNGAEAE